ncbi:glycosyltransferase [Flavobacterium sp.]|uniref:glycosyltransferase n=1 Tax=Flavobacterium sp. TaxID=239 RepID=UPI002FDED42C
MLSVVIRNKNQSKALEFLLSNLKNRYSGDIDEIIVLDNLSTDNSKDVTLKYGAKFKTIEKFSYGGSANIAAEAAKHQYIVIFSAHSYPVSPDFFKVIKEKFLQNPNLAGLRCLHSTNDYRNFISGISARQDPNKSGLIFSGSAFNKFVWQKIPFNELVPTFEDKDWTKRVLKEGYDIDFAPVVFNYEIKRSDSQNYFRFTRDLLGNYQIWHQDISFISVLKGFLIFNINNCKLFGVNIYYSLRRLLFVFKFVIKKPKKFDY